MVKRLRNKNELDITTAFMAVLIVAVALFVVGIEYTNIPALVVGIGLIGWAVFTIYKQTQKRF